jgi:hypothetical protein
MIDHLGQLATKGDIEQLTQILRDALTARPTVVKAEIPTVQAEMDASIAGLNWPQRMGCSVCGEVFDAYPASHIMLYGGPYRPSSARVVGKSKPSVATADEDVSDTQGAKREADKRKRELIAEGWRDHPPMQN